jgi:hypothetical protein
MKFKNVDSKRRKVVKIKDQTLEKTSVVEADFLKSHTVDIK